MKAVVGKLILGVMLTVALATVLTLGAAFASIGRDRAMWNLLLLAALKRGLAANPI